jgi:transcriptional regulator with XRE-family HTH domain
MAKSFDELVRRTTTKSVRDRAKRRTRELLGELLLSEIRQRAGKSQSDVAKALGIRQPSLSKLEKQHDMQISTLGRIVKVLGGELEVIAKFPKGAVRIGPFGTKARSSRRYRSRSKQTSLALKQANVPLVAGMPTVV